MGGQEVVERVQRLEPQHPRVGDAAPVALAGEEPHALKHPLNAEEVAFGMGLRPRDEKLPLAAADLDLERTRQVERKRTGDVRHVNDGIDDSFLAHREDAPCHLPESRSSRTASIAQRRMSLALASVT